MTDKLLRVELDFEGLDLPIEIKDIHKIEKRILVALVFLDKKANKNIGFMCQKNTFKNLDLSLLSLIH